MTKVWIAVIAGGVGVFVGVQICKYYAKTKVQSGVDSLLGSVGLGGGAIQGFADQYIVPSAVS